MANRPSKHAKCRHGNEQVPDLGPPSPSKYAYAPSQYAYTSAAPVAMYTPVMVPVPPYPMAQPGMYATPVMMAQGMPMVATPMTQQPTLYPGTPVIPATPMMGTPPRMAEPLPPWYGRR